ncbi:MAG: F0F1 ATP synthase subunit B [Lachnospiraceae bacterium]|nr:F0F1 ATP synthase subunit B [Lachnospiraceae bacterium]
MQPSEVISVNIWQILISLCNLLILFLILKKLLYKPVKKAMADRQQSIDDRYSAAKKAEELAEQSKAEYEDKLKNAGSEAKSIVKSATDKANRRSDKIIADAKEKADVIVKQAKNEAELEKKKAVADVHKEIVEVSAMLTEKILEREITSADHRDFIDSFIKEIGDENDGNK